MKTFAEKIEDVRRLTRSLKTLPINLAIAAADKEYAMAGNMFYVIHAPDAASYINVRFNDISSPQMKLTRMLGMRVPHERVFITTPAGQSGTLEVLHGLIDPDLFAIIDNRTAADITLDALLDEVRGDTTSENWDTEETIGVAFSTILGTNTDRKGFHVQAKSTNGGIIYIGFGNDVTTTKWVAELSPGQAFGMDNFRGQICAIATVANQKLGYGEW